MWGTAAGVLVCVGVRARVHAGDYLLPRSVLVLVILQCVHLKVENAVVELGRLVLRERHHDLDG